MNKNSSSVTGLLGLHLRSDLHLARKTWHLLMGLTAVWVYLGAGLSPSAGVVILGSILGLDLLVETARLRIPSFNERVLRTWGPLMRADEVNRMSGTPHYLAAMILAIAIFPKPVAALSILFLAFGDPMASLVGILYGKYGPRIARGKSLIGSAAGVATCFVVALVFLGALSIAQGPTLVVLALIGALAGGLAELLPLDLDDNFVIPIVSGFVLWLSFIALGL